VKPGFRSPKQNKNNVNPSQSFAETNLIRRESMSLEQRKAALGLNTDDGKKNLYKIAPTTTPLTGLTNNNSHTNPYKAKTTGSNSNIEPLSPPPSSSSTSPPPPSSSSSSSSFASAPPVTSSAGITNSESLVVEALYDHQGDTSDGELSLVCGARYIIINSQKPDGWWEAYKEDDPSQKGLVPSNFLKKVS